MATPTEWLSEFKVNTGTANTPFVADSQVIGLSNGNFLVAWDEPGTNGVGTDPDTDVVGKIFDAEGMVVVDSFQINSNRNADDEGDFSLAATNDGGFIIAYVDDDSTSNDISDIIWERFDASGQRTNAQVVASSNDPDGQLSNPQVVVDQSDNSSYVTWTDSTLVNDDDVRAARLTSTATITATFNPGFSSNDDNLNASTINHDGNLVTVYRTGNDLRLREHDASGTQIRSSTIVDGTADANADPVVATLTNGNIAYASVAGGDVFHNVYTPSGGGYTATIALPNFYSTATGSDNQNDPQIVALPDGGFVIVWDNDSTNAFEGRRFNADGTGDGSTFIIDDAPSGNRFGDVGVTSDGRLVFAWDFSGDVYASIFDPRDGNTLNAADSGGAVVTAKVTGSTIVGTTADETFLGQGGDDNLIGDGGDDTLKGGGGDDFIRGGQGADDLDGGAGNDTVSYLDSPGGVVVNLSTSTAENSPVFDPRSLEGNADGDVIARFENVIGSGFKDVLTGDGGANILSGQLGNDTIRGGGGNDIIEGGSDSGELDPGGDVLDGGAGIDTVSYAGSNGGVMVNLASGAASGGHAERDTISNFENLTGSGSSDMLLGSSGENTILGLAGDDALVGGEAVDLSNTAGGQVYRIYQATLDRAPDTGGFEFWTEELESGSRSLQQVVSGFTNSGEFQNTFGNLNNSDFVTLLYNNVLDRAPDAAGLNGWLDAIASGTSRAQVVTGFSESAEFRNDTSVAASAYTEALDGRAQSGFLDDVYRLYQATLDRDPDQAGLEVWSNQFADGQAYTTIASGFTNSGEFRNTYGTLSDSNFIRQLYRNVLDREADSAGLQGWLNVINNGGTREDVVRGFAQSGEFVGNTAADFEAYMKAGGGDTLDGGSGNDLLYSGKTADTFVFDASEDGSDLVLQLDTWDTLEFEGFGYNSAADARAQMSTIGSDVRFVDEGVTVTFAGATLSTMQEVDYLFT